MKKRSSFLIFASMLLGVSQGSFANPELKEMMGEFEKESAKFDLSDLYSEKIEDTAQTVADNLVTPLRKEMIESVALSLGTQAGLAKKAQEGNARIDAWNKKNNNKLDKTFDFNLVKLEDGVVAPVVYYGTNVYNQASDREVRAAQEAYRIHKQARFVSSPLHWTEYLYVEVINPDVPDKAVMPQTPAERKLWNKWLEKGWKEGEAQAVEMFKDNYNRLVSEYDGMINYHIAFAQNKISRPVIKRKAMGVTNNGDEVFVGDVQITKEADSRFNTSGFQGGKAKTPAKNTKTKKSK